MGSKWSNLNLPGALHFVTGNFRDRIPVFKDGAMCDVFFQVLHQLRTEWPSKLIAYVLMPDHFHSIVNPRNGDIQGFTGALKSMAARDIIEITNDRRFEVSIPKADGSVHQVWQESFKAQPLWSGWMIWQKINYIHANPVKAKLVNSARDYPWSSFRAFYSDSDKPLPVDKEWWWPDDNEKFSKAVRELGWRTYHKRNSQ